jgi:hypothetical protein
MQIICVLALYLSKTECIGKPDGTLFKNRGGGDGWGMDSGN